MHTSKKASTTKTQACNKAILNQKRFDKKVGKGKKRSSSSTVAVKSVLCLATAVFSTNIPVTSGFSSANIFGRVSVGSQSKSSNRLSIDVATSDLKYRTHENSEEQQCQHEKAASDLSSKLQPKHCISNFIHTWWTSAKSNRAIEQAAKAAENDEKKQLVLDEYLESIDRRYKRMHKYDRMRKAKANAVSLDSSNGGRRRRYQEQDPDTVTSAWQFLLQQDPASQVEEQRKQEDAIYVLGLANLASKRLLQKHNLPIPTSDESSSVVIDVDSANSHAVTLGYDLVSESKDEATAVAPSTKTEIATDSRTKQSLIRNLALPTLYCLQFFKMAQEVYLSSLSAVSTRLKSNTIDSIKAGRRAFSVLLKKIANMIIVNGGGKYSIQIMSIFATTLMTGAIGVLRPLINKA
jgi:hypothetical protein